MKTTNRPTLTNTLKQFTTIRGDNTLIERTTMLTKKLPIKTTTTAEPITQEKIPDSIKTKNVTESARNSTINSKYNSETEKISTTKRLKINSTLIITSVNYSSAKLSTNTTL